LLVFRLGKAAPVEFVVVQVAPDCRRIGRFRVPGHSGVNRVRFRGRVGGRALGPGTYRIKARTLPRGRAVVDTQFVVVMHPERRVIASARGADACGSKQGWQSFAIPLSASALGKPKAAAAHARVKAPSHGRPSRAHGVLGARFAKDAVGAFKSIPSLLYVLLGVAIGLLAVSALPSRVAPTRRTALLLALHRGAVALTGTALLIAVLVAVTVAYALL
jgi:hypothetical protein